MASSQGLGRIGSGLDFDSGGEFFHARPIAGFGGEIFAAIAEVIVELRQQQRLLAELIGPRDTRDADRSKSFVPQPRSERAEMVAV